MLQVSLLGAGPSGERHARALATLADRCLLTGVHDPDPAAAARTAEALGIPVLDGPAAVLDGTDAAVVAGAVEQRVALASAALEQGVDVLAEPPLATGPQLANGLLSAVVRAPRRPVVMVAAEDHFDPTVRALQELLRDETLISVHAEHTQAAAPGPAPLRSDDVICELLTRDLPVVLALSAEPVTATQASGRRLRRGGPIDHAEALLTLEDETVVTLVASRAGGPHVHRITVTTLAGRFTADLDARCIDAVRTTRGPEGQVLSGVERIEIAAEDPALVQAEAFLRCIERRTPPKVGIGQAIAAQEIAEAIAKRIELVAHRPARAA